jgi:hypothetical protein
MSVESIDYVYLETHDWTRSAAFWEGRGFRLALNLGRAGRFEPTSGGPGIFVEEVTANQALAFEVYLRVDGGMDADPAGTRSGTAISFEDSHWGTELARVRDPDGREFVLQRDKDPKPG